MDATDVQNLRAVLTRRSKAIQELSELQSRIATDETRRAELQYGIDADTIAAEEMLYLDGAYGRDKADEIISVIATSIAQVVEENQQAEPPEPVGPVEEPFHSRVRSALSVARRWGRRRYEYELAWVIDQMVRCLAADKYEHWVAERKKGKNGPNTYDWDTGLAPMEYNPPRST